jgi:hypothetical protein
MLFAELPIYDDFILLYQIEYSQYQQGKLKEVFFYDQRGIPSYGDFKCYSGPILDNKAVALLLEYIAMDLTYQIKDVKIVDTIDIASMQQVDMTAPYKTNIFGEKGKYFSTNPYDFIVYFDEIFYYVMADAISGRGILIEDSTANQLEDNISTIILEKYAREYDPSSQRAYYWFDSQLGNYRITLVQFSSSYSELLSEILFPDTFSQISGLGDLDNANATNIQIFDEPYRYYFSDYPDLTFVIVSSESAFNSRSQLYIKLGERDEYILLSVRDIAL